MKKNMKMVSITFDTEESGAPYVSVVDHEWFKSLKIGGAVEAISIFFSNDRDLINFKNNVLSAIENIFREKIEGD